MKIRPIGHAGFIVEAQGKRILIDPWFNPAFCGTWKPPCPELADEVAGLKYDYVWVSHTHEDHCDKRFLERVKHVPFLQYLSMGDNLGNSDAEFTTFYDEYRDDSMLLIDDGTTRALFANDCNLDRCDWPKNIDILACQFSGASYYPSCYDYDAETMQRKVREARLMQMRMLVDKIEATNAKAYIPCAGPADIKGVRNGPGTPFPYWDEVESAFKYNCPDVAIIPEGPETTLTLTGKKSVTTITLPEWLHDKITAGEVTWEEALLTFKVRLSREPDVYDREVMEKLRGRG